MASFHFELVSPERLLFSGDVEAVIVPGVEGEFTVLKDHAPLMATLRPGLVEIDEAAGKTVRLFVRGGFVDVAPGGLTILADNAVPLEQFDEARLSLEITAAEAALAAAVGEEPQRLARERLTQIADLRARLA